MYSMQIKVLGFTVRLEVVVISLIVGALLGCHVLCGCARKHEVKKKVKEGMQMLGAAVNYSMSDGVPGSYGKGRLQPYAQDLDTHTGPKLPLPPGEMFFFADTVFKPEWLCMCDAGTGELHQRARRKQSSLHGFLISQN